jgi:DNA-binding Lrp family transcriptional regulator
MHEKNSDTTDIQAVIDRLERRLRDATLDIAWRQWAALGGMTSTRRRANAVVDPEALVLVSLALWHEEPRLGDLVHDWATSRSSFLSVQRMRNLVAEYPLETRQRLLDFARVAATNGKDHRWKKVLASYPETARAGTLTTARKNKKRVARPRFIEAATLMVRLRLGIGVGIKADALTVLLGLQEHDGAWASVRAIANAVGYSERAVRTAVEEMAGARLIEEIEAENEPKAYRANANGWKSILEVKSLPPWRHWHERFVFVARFQDWAAARRMHPTSRYAFGSLGRQLIEHNRASFERNHVVTWTTNSLSNDSADFVEQSIESLAEWMVENA